MMDLKKETNQNMEKQAVRFMMQKSTNIVHDKTCKLIKETEESDLVGLTQLEKYYLMCPKCQKTAMIRNAIKDDDNLSWYIDFFNHANYGVRNVKGFIYLKNVELSKISNLSLKLKHRTDSWIVSYVKRNRYYLFHNDYVVTHAHNRHIVLGKFHLQAKDPMRLKDAFRYIALYDWAEIHS